MMGFTSSSSRNGSIYLITLVSVVAIVSMVLIGVRLRSTTSTQSALIEQMAEGNHGVIDATQYAIERITTDSNWNLTAQSGVVFNKLAVGDSTYTGRVVDADTGKTVLDSTTNYRVTVSAAHGDVLSSAQIDITGTQVDYVGLLQSLGARHYWKLNEVPGSNRAADSVGSYDGVFKDTTVPGAAKNDEGALVPLFTSSNDEAEVAWGNDFKKDKGSISLWMKLTDTNKFSSSAILGMLYKSGGRPTLNLTVFQFGISAYVAEGGDYSFSNFATTPSNSISPNTWHHVVMVWGPKGMFVYIDGVERASNSSTDGTDTADANKGGKQPLLIGGGYFMTPFSQSKDGFKGSIAHVAYFGRQLNASKVAQLAAVRPDLITFTIVDGSWVRVFE